MANKKISALTPNTSPTGSEEFVYAYSNSNGKITLNTMKTFASADSQPTLVSGTNIKTVNGTSLLGSGDITVSGGQGTYDCVVAADGTGDYTTLYAAFTAGKRNVFIKNGTYNETPLSVVDDSFNIVGESPDGTILNYSITAGAYQTGGACITFSTSTKTSTADVINHTISGITFKITETGSEDNLSGYFINANGASGNPAYTVNVSNCNIDVTQTGANVRYYDIIANQNTLLHFGSCTISVHSSDYDTLYMGTYTGGGTYFAARLTACIIDVYTTSNNGVQTRFMGGAEYIGCYINTHTSGTGTSSCTVYNATNCYIFSSGNQQNTAGLTMKYCDSCVARVTNPYGDLHGLTYSTAVEAWASSTSYSLGDFVTDDGNIYYCTEAHTSGDTMDYTKFSYLYVGCSLSFVTNSRINSSTSSSILKLDGTCTGNVFDLWGYWLTIGDDKGGNSGTTIANNITSTNGVDWFKVMGQLCIVEGNQMKSTYGIRYNDGYHIIKNNIIMSYSSSTYPTVAIVGTDANHSKVSDNILRYWQD